MDPHTTGLHDPLALAEIELYGEILTAVAGTDRRLTLEEIDHALGLRGAPPDPERRGGSVPPPRSGRHSPPSLRARDGAGRGSRP